MTAWQTETVEADPHIVLTDWAVMQIEFASPGASAVTRHFIGVRTGKPPRVQVSSPVVAFDPSSARGRTESGRIYQLNGFSPASAPVLATWARWMDIHRIAAAANVTSEVVRDIFAAVGAFRKQS